MMKKTFEDIRNEGLLLYEYIRGSHAYGLQKSDGTSDVDTAGVYLEPIEQLLGLGLDYQDQITDERHDNVWWSLKKFLTLLLNSNPTMLEALFIPQDKVLYEHPIITEIKRNRNLFVTKECFKTFLGYGKTQIQKARGLNKKIVNPILKRLGPLDFVYTFKEQGSTKFIKFLEERGLKQEYCGLVNIPNMAGMYGVYYDWGSHLRGEGIEPDDLVRYSSMDCRPMGDIFKDISENDAEELHKELNLCQKNAFAEYVLFNIIKGAESLTDNQVFKAWYHSQQPKGYKGIVSPNGTSSSLRLSSVEKGEKPIASIHYNESGYIKHCLDYKNYKDWEKNRNPERYKENCEKDFDRKNMAHAVRLMHMGIEIAKNGEVNVDRTNIDREFIMNIRLGDMEYGEIIDYLNKKESEMKEAMEKSTIPEHIDREKVNEILLNIRETQLQSHVSKNE